MSTHLLSREGVDDVLASPALQRAAPDAFPIATTAALLNLLADFSSKTTTVFRGLIDSSHSAQQRLSSLSWRVAAANDSVAALERSRSHGGDAGGDGAGGGGAGEGGAGGGRVRGG